MIRRTLLFAPLLAIAAAAPAQSPAPRFDPIRFFAGRTEGEGRMAILLGLRRTVHVHGRGHLEPDGTLILDQTVEREKHAATRRQWRIRRIGPGRYAGTLTDASGPVDGEASGDRLRLSYPAKGGVRIEQQLVLSADGRSARNRLVARKFGLVVARLDEVIRKPH